MVLLDFLPQAKVLVNKLCFNVRFTAYSMPNYNGFTSDIFAEKLESYRTDFFHRFFMIDFQVVPELIMWEINLFSDIIKLGKLNDCSKAESEKNVTWISHSGDNSQLIARTAFIRTCQINYLVDGQPFHWVDFSLYIFCVLGTKIPNLIYLNFQLSVQE